MSFLMKRSRMLAITVAASLFCASLSLTHAESTNPPVPRRERIGLVLAGGGALGMAHVGVLKVLEEQRVPIAFVAGTSMGSIVGAAYATGQTVADMEQVLIESDWDQIFSDGVGREEIAYRSKTGRNREIYGDTKISLSEGKLVTPFGAVQGQRLLPVLQTLYRNSPPSPADFDKFRIPLRVVAADIETGEAVVVAKGDLSTAVRASMSVPGVFAPVEMDGRMLVDGGIVNNLPMDVVRGMGADRVIVVELNADLKKKEDLRSPLSTSGQIISLLLAQNSAIQKKTLTKRDVLIEPILKGYSAVDFGKAAELIKLGEEAARRVLPQLKQLGISEREYERFQARREAVVEDPTIEFVTIKTDKRGAEEQISHLFAGQPGAKLDRAQIDSKIEQIYDSGEFVSVKYGVVERDGKTGIEVNAQRKPWLDNYFRFGATLQDDFKGENNYTLGGAYRINEITSQGGWAQGEVMIGFSPKISGEFYQPLTSGSPYFVTPRFDISRQTIYPTQNGDIVAQYERAQYLVGAGFGRQLGRSGEILAEYRAADANITRHIGDPDLPEQNYQVGEVALVMNYDSADNPDFPTTGVLAKGAFVESSQSLGSSDNFEQFTASLSKPITWGRDTLLVSGDFGQSIGDLPVYRSAAFGGFLNFSGLTQNSLLASDWRVGRLNYYRRFSEVGSALLGLGFFVGGSVEYGTFISDAAALPDNKDLFAGSTFLGVDTPVIPIYFGFGMAEQGEKSFYFAVGRLTAR